MNLLPKVKKLEIHEGYLKKGFIAPYKEDIDDRLKKAIDKLPTGQDGALLLINTKGTDSEGYKILIKEDSIEITSEGLNGVFYAIQTLRQIFKTEKNIPCLYIEDEPDFSYRGLYQDMTRGKVAKVETLKKLIDQMAYFKMNSLQLYVEHAFEFEETKELIKRTGYITKEEIKELDEYCYENFIEFIPSIATFGHMYEILEQDQYKHLRIYKDTKNEKNFWKMRMLHHTIDPLNEESIELVKSLIDQYYPLYKTDKFNICGDETFDLKHYGDGVDTGKLYVDFVMKIINHLKSKNKKVMMWADVLLSHPETIDVLPEDTYFLNWNYRAEPPEDKVAIFEKLNRKQIVCPGTTSWSRMCENVEVEEQNITKMIDYGHKYGAIGVLNTNWGDYANPASIDLAMYGIVLGAAKSWNVATALDAELYADVNLLVYGAEGALEYLRKISRLQWSVLPTDWGALCHKYYEARYGEVYNAPFDINGEEIIEIQKESMEIVKELSAQKWGNDEAREEMIICAEANCVFAQANGKLCGISVENVVDTEDWLKKYEKKWLQKNKSSEFYRIKDMLLEIEGM